MAASGVGGTRVTSCIAADCIAAASCSMRGAAGEPFLSPGTTDPGEGGKGGMERMGRRRGRGGDPNRFQELEK